MDGLGAVLDIFDPLVNNDGKVTIVDLKFKGYLKNCFFFRIL